jgi:hypothetical protein
MRRLGDQEAAAAGGLLVEGEGEAGLDVESDFESLLVSVFVSLFDDDAESVESALAPPEDATFEALEPERLSVL